MKKLSISAESHEKRNQKRPVLLLDWIKIELDVKERVQKYKTSGQFFGSLYVWYLIQKSQNI